MQRIRVKNIELLLSPSFKCRKDEIVWKDTQSAFENRIQTGVMFNKTHIDPRLFLDACSKAFKAKLNSVFKKEEALKINAILCCEFKSIQDKEEVFKLNYVDTKSASIFKYDDFKTWYAENVQEPILASLEEFPERNSGWNLSAIVNLKVNINKYTMLLGCSFVDLPNEIKLKKACVNVRNKDDACFAWAVVAALYPVRSGSNRISKYPHYESVLKLAGIQFPMTVEQIPRFERQNNLSITLFVLKLNSEQRTKDKFIVLPTYVSNDVKKTHINLMLIQNKYGNENDTGHSDDEDLAPIRYHYVWIKHLSRLLSAQLSSKNIAKHICNRCLHFFYSSEKLAEHTSDCAQSNICKFRLPSEDCRNIAFRNYPKKKRAPFVIYSDIECLSSGTRSYEKRVPCNVAFYVKCSYDPTLSFYKSYRGEDCISWFACELQQFAEDVETVFICRLPNNELSDQEAELLKDKSRLCLCYVCEKPFIDGGRRIPVYCRFTGVYKGPAHEVCNMNFKASYAIPVFFHNLSDYDSHFFIEKMETIFEGRIDLNTLQNNESFISFTKYTDNAVPIRFRFIDSNRFLNESLETLVSYLTDFPVSVTEMSDAQFKHLTKKVIYPDKYVDNVSKFLETALPPIEKFNGVTAVDYVYAERVWNELGLQNLGDYSDLRIKMNVLLLAEAFEEFRNTCLENYGVEPSYYNTLQAYSWDVMLRYTNISLELLTDVDMVMFIERGIRSGFSQCSKRYSKANNMYLENFNYKEPSRFLIHFGMTNQHDWPMSQYLPYGNFKWVEDLNNFEVESVTDESLIGYVLEVDLEYPNDIHDLHKDLPFCPEYRTQSDSNAQESLTATLHDKFKYVLHYRYLKQVLKHGLRLTKIHRILQFEQSPWLKSYIDLNRHLSISAKNDFESKLFELMSYAVFENSVKSIRKDGNVKLVSKWRFRCGAEAFIAKPKFRSSTIISEKLVSINIEPKEIFLNKPIYIGMCILDLIKTRLYSFHYEYMQRKFGQDCTICYADTDSLLYEVTENDIYESIREDCEQEFDTSDYPYKNLWGIPRVNRKALGSMKDRNNGRVISEFVGLRSKMFAVRLDESVKVKGIDKEILARRIKFTDYLDYLGINNKTKLVLTPKDNKRHLIENSYETLPWGHYSLPKL